MVLVLPNGTRLSADGRTAVLPDDLEVSAVDEVDVGGGHAEFDKTGVLDCSPDAPAGCRALRPTESTRVRVDLG